MNWKNLPIVAFDTETTGLSPWGGDRIVEFAAVTLRLGPGDVAEVVDRTSFLINPGIEIPKAVTQITGISDADVAGKPSFAEVAGEIRRLLAGAVTVAHNYPFDLGFLTVQYQLLGQPKPEPLAEIDTVDLSLRCFPDARSHKLGDLCKRLDVVLEGAHRATNDAEACGRAFSELVRTRAVVDDLQEMLDWAYAIGRPPEDGPFVLDDHGRVRFADGKYAGEPAGDHPTHLAWMEKAVHRTEAGWGPRYSEATRRWIRRWLDVRGAGRARAGGKGTHANEWGPWSCLGGGRVA